MRIVFDQGTPVPLKQYLSAHQVETAYELGWSRLTNGDLLAAAEDRFDVLVTTDRNLRHQQPLAGRKLAPGVAHDELAQAPEPDREDSVCARIAEKRRIPGAPWLNLPCARA